MATENYVRELLAHLDIMGVACEPTADQAAIVINDPKALFELLTDEEFISRQASAPVGPPVPNHRSDNPVGALMEWCQQRGPQAKMPVFKQSENVGTVHAPRFSCAVICDGITKKAEEPRKVDAKRKATQMMLDALAERYNVKESTP